MNAYKELLGTLVVRDQKPVPEAFSISERYRARSFLDLLAERDLSVTTDLSPQIAGRRQKNLVAYDKAQMELMRLSPVTEKEKVKVLRDELKRLMVERNEIAQDIKKLSPRFASLQYPQPLNLDEARGALDEGTLLLSFVTGPSVSWLLVINSKANEDRILTLPVSDAALRSKVKDLRSELELTPGIDTPRFAGLARELYDLLLKPAEEQIQSSSRLLIIADGPLHSLPFSVLTNSNNQYLIELKPIHIAASATVYRELKQRGKAVPDSKIDMVAFGNPRLEDAAETATKRDGDAQVAAMAERGYRFAPLPFSGQEAQVIGDIYKGRSRVLTGSDATEESAKSLGPNIRYIHFATHAVLDEEFPMNSAVVLSIPKYSLGGRDNGLLQIWEIFEQMRINADLVTLSACNTAVGQEVGGEGMMGLMRAFSTRVRTL